MAGSLASLSSLALGVGIALGAVGCADDDAALERPTTPPRTSIAIDGARAPAPLLRRVGDLFERAYPRVRVRVRRSRTSEGIDRLCLGQVPIAAADRDLTDEERRTCRRNGIFVRSLPLAHEAVGVVASPGLEIDCMPVEDLRRLWRPGPALESWKALDPSRPSVRIELVGPPATVPVFDFFTEALTGEQGAVTRTYEQIASLSTLVERVERSDGALGVAGVGDLERLDDPPDIVSIDGGGGGGCVAPTAEAVQSGRYDPLARTLSLHVSLEGLRRFRVDPFLDFLVDRTQALAPEAGLVPLSDDELERARRVVGRGAAAAAAPARQ